MAPQTAATQAALKITTQVLPGHKLEIQLPSDTIVGQDIEVFVPLPEEPCKSEQTEKNSESCNVLEIIRQGRHHRTGMSAEQIDEYLRTERDSWDL